MPIKKNNKPAKLIEKPIENPIEKPIIKGNKNYKVVLEYLSIRLITDNLDWGNKCLKVNNQTEYLIINIQRLEKSIGKNVGLPDLEIGNTSALSHNDIIKYWANLETETNFKNNLEIIKNLTLNIDYFVVPYYIINNVLILGIVIFNNGYHVGSNSITGKYKVVETYNYMSDIKPKKPINALVDKYKISILDGIVNCKINNNGVITSISKEILKDKYIKINNNGLGLGLGLGLGSGLGLTDLNISELCIKWEYIFRNISNYLPKLEIIYKNNQNKTTNFFQNRLNP